MKARRLVEIFTLSLTCLSLVTIAASQTKADVPIQSNGNILYDLQRLSASGTAIVNGSGNKVVLKATSIDWNEYSKGYFSVEDLQKMKSAGGNCLEIHILRFVELMPQRDAINEAYFVNNLDKWVSWCEQMQIYCIINLRDLTWSNSFGIGMPEWMLNGHGYGSPPYNKTMNDKACIDFWDTDNPLHDDNRESFTFLWKTIANRYKNNQYAMFSIVNEPLNFLSLTTTQSSHLGTTYSTFMETVVDAIRSIGADQLIFIDKPYVAEFGQIQPVNRDNIVWEDHLYVTAEGWDLPTFSQWESRMKDEIIRRFVGDFQRPLYVGEYGVVPINMTGWRTILLNEVTFLKNSEVAGYSWHTWGLLEGEWYDHEINYLNQADSDYVIQTIYG